ncbi:MAG: iron ABC transporter permease, partial [Peptococcaceae bacterium]|nr:iron ABC transporter permease [Peptococcaceae bacterium]
RQGQKFYVTKGGLARGAEIPLGICKWPSFIFIFMLFAVSVLLPLGVLGYWSYTGIVRGALDQRFFGFALNSLSTAGIASILSMTFALPVVYLKLRHPSIVSYSLDKMAYAGYALPGVVVALGLVFVFSNYLPFLYGSMAMLIISYVVRFLPQNMQAVEASLNLVSPRIEEAGRSLGLPPWQTLFKITLPVVAPGILAGGAFVFVSALKELPATLLLRPPGLDTLAVRVWIEAGEGFYHAAAPAALIIILISILPLKWMLSKY